MFIQYSKPTQKLLVAASETQIQRRPEGLREGGQREKLRKRERVKLRDGG